MGRKAVTTKEYVRRCWNKLGDQFDYSETVYTTARDAIKVTCKKHGSFVVEARNHLRLNSGGCSQCRHDESRLRLQDFVKRANEIHAAKYDYSRVTYDNLNQKVTIICPIHGEFDQKASHHLSGHECEKCGFNKRGKSRRARVAAGIIERFTKVHGNTYDYSKVDYQRTHEPVTINCRSHGAFRQEPVVHLMGCGCPLCSGNVPLTQSEFLRKANEVHGNRYDYSLAKVNGVDRPVEIICTEHGTFWQTPYSHLNGANCQRCAGVALMTREEAIASFRETHGHKYDYSLVDYKNNLTKITIICAEHGPFYPTPVNHRRGRGCPGCASFGFDATKPAILYYARIDDVTRGTLYKIGITNRSFDERYGQEDLGKMTLIKTWEFEDGRRALQGEQEIIREYVDFQYRGPVVILSSSADQNQHREVFVCDILALDHDLLTDNAAK